MRYQNTHRRSTAIFGRSVVTYFGLNTNDRALFCDAEELIVHRTRKGQDGPSRSSANIKRPSSRWRKGVFVGNHAAERRPPLRCGK
jgi:hypothetical protein